MMTGIIQDQNLEKQMGCMAGFFQLFDRHQFLTGKRLYSSAKRLTSSPSPIADTRAEESEKPKETKSTVPTPATLPQSPAPEISIPSKILPVFNSKEGTRSPWKLGREAPRLSLDSRATVDTKGKLYPKEIRPNAMSSSPSINSEIDGEDEKCRSTSVIARLMGLEPFPYSAPEPAKNPELRRSASESRVSKDLFRFIDGNNFQLKPFVQPNLPKNTKIEKNVSSCSNRPWKSPRHRKNYFDSEDFFPEPKENISIYNEIERRFRMRGIDEPCKDLETLKQILEAMQLKGLLHNKKPSDWRNYVYEESPIVLMKPKPIQRSKNLRSGIRRSSINGGDQTRNTSSPTRRETSSRNSPSSSPVRRQGSELGDQRRASPVGSPRLLSPRRRSPDPTVENRSLSNRRFIAVAKEKIGLVGEDESASVSGSTVSSSSHTDAERSKMEEYKGGRSLLERCDKLLHSIAEMTTAELQPSPVSVLDLSFYEDESSTPSPIMKRSTHFKDEIGEYEDIWSPASSPIKSQREATIHDCDYIYISDILSAYNYLPDNSDIFLLLEKQQYLKGNDTSKASQLQRKLIFDTINEILNRNRKLPPRKLGKDKPSLSHIWSEFLKFRERDTAEDDLFDAICGVLRKDLAQDAINGWGDCHMEVSEAVLDIERLIFKDLVGEAIRDLATFGGNKVVYAPRRKLVF